MNKNIAIFLTLLLSLPFYAQAMLSELQQKQVELEKILVIGAHKKLNDIPCARANFSGATKIFLNDLVLEINENAEALLEVISSALNLAQVRWMTLKNIYEECKILGIKNQQLSATQIEFFIQHRCLCEMVVLKDLAQEICNNDRLVQTINSKEKMNAILTKAFILLEKFHALRVYALLEYLLYLESERAQEKPLLHMFINTFNEYYIQSFIDRSLSLTPEKKFYFSLNASFTRMRNLENTKLGALAKPCMCCQRAHQSKISSVNSTIGILEEH